MSIKFRSNHVGNQPSNDELRPIAERLLKELDPDGDTSVNDVLNDPEYSGFKTMVVQAFQLEKRKLEAERRAEEARQQKELKEKKAEKAAKLQVLACEKLGLDLPPKPLTAEELQAQLSIGDKLELVGMPPDLTKEREIPKAVTELNEELRETLPGNVFKIDVKAVTFRGWLGFWVQRLKEEMAKNDLPDEYRQALTRRQQEFTVLFGAIGRVIMAWGLDPKLDRSEPSDFVAVRKQLEVPGSRFYWLTQPPKVETLEEKTAREQAEAEAKAAAEAAQALKLGLRTRLVERLLELDLADFGKDKLFKEQAEAMAGRIVKFYQHLASEGIEAMFRLAAIDKKVRAKTKGDEATALIYAKAGNMPAEELESTVNARHQLNAERIQRERERRQAPGYGAEKPETANNARKKNKKGGDKKNGQKRASR